MNSTKNITISKRYAKSLFDSTRDGVVTPEIAQNSLRNIREILKSSLELYVALTNPAISIEDKKNVINKVFEYDCDKTTINFLKLLVVKNRFNLIFNIVEEFEHLLNESRNITLVSVTSALELDENKKKRIEDKLSKKLNKKVSVSYNVDDSIIAGLVFKIEDNVLDTSLSHQLGEFRKEMLK